MAAGGALIVSAECERKPWCRLCWSCAFSKDLQHVEECDSGQESRLYHTLPKSATKLQIICTAQVQHSAEV